MLAVFVNLLFVGVLVFSVSWQNRPPEAVTAELYAPPPPAPRHVEPPPQLKPVPPPPKPVPPPPKPEPVPEPVPPMPEPVPPKPVPKTPQPVVEKPDTRSADIALKARREVERREQEQAERERVQREARKQEEARKEAEARKAEDKRQAELRDRQQRQLEAMRAQAAQEAQMRTQAERELQMRAQAERESRTRAQAERESRMRAQAEQEARVRAEQAASGAARNNAQLHWIDQIRSRIRPNINLPPDIPGNPEAVFDIVQLPTGEIIDVKLRKSSGVRAYDDAVQRAILKSSPLPKPVPTDLFQRSLELRFRPLDQ